MKALYAFRVITASMAMVNNMTLQDLQQIGITPESVAHAIGFGFAVVASFAIAGWAVGIVISIVRKI